MANEPHFRKTKSLSGPAQDRGFEDTRGESYRGKPLGPVRGKLSTIKKPDLPKNERTPAKTKWRER